MQAQTSASKKIVWVADGIGYRILADGKTKAYCIDYFDAAGKRVRSFKHPETGESLRRETDARAALAHVIVSKAKGTQLVKSTVTLNDLAQEWLGRREIDARSGTMAGWRSNLNLHVLPALGRLEVSKISENHIRNLMLEKRREKKSEATIANIVQPLRLILDEAVVQRVISVNPWDRVPKKERPKPSQTQERKRILSIDEVDRLLASAVVQGARAHALVSAYLYAGLRLSEALGLVWEDVDLDAGLIRVRFQLGRDKGGEKLRTPLKTNSSSRDIPVARELRQALLKWKLASLHTADADFVFATSTGTPLTQRNAFRLVMSIAEKARINEARPADAPADWRPAQPNMDIHSLRHVFASAMIRVTRGDAEAVAALTGHADTEILTKVYSHEFEAVRGGVSVAEKAAMIDAAFSG